MRLEQILLLWFIREYGPISFNRLWEWLGRIDRDPDIMARLLRFPSVVERFGTAHNREIILYGMINTWGADMQALNNAGLIEITTSTEDGEELFAVTDKLRFIQGIFGLSLTDLLSQREGAVTAYPFWGKPITQSAKPAQVFVAMPFAAPLRPVYDDHILKVTAQLGLTCRRGDDFFSGNNIMDEVWSAIYHAELCIVDCTGRNPNVFYELGIAHAIGRKSILNAQALDDIPFDVRHLRIIQYEQTPDGLVEFDAKLKKTLVSEMGL